MDANELEKCGGLAFPGPDGNGMTLRDYFAGQAIAGFVQAAAGHTSENTYNEFISQAVNRAYSVADTMIVRRNKKK